MTLIDTAEMYAEGSTEEIVGEAIRGRRDEVYLVSKAYPHNASAKGIKAACERSLQRLDTEIIDLYLLRWRGQYPLSETVAAFERLREQGKILRWGVSNFDVADLQELDNPDCATNQVLYRPRIARHRIRPVGLASATQHGAYGLLPDWARRSPAEGRSATARSRQERRRWQAQTR